MPDQQFNVSVWIALGSAIAATLAACFSFWSARTAHRVFGFAREQEQRRRQGLVLYLVDGYIQRRKIEPRRLYSFLISISNPSDSNNSVARLDLRINYRTQANYCAAVDVPLAGIGKGEQNQNEAVALLIPLRVDAHQTATGWARFEVNDELLSACTMDRYAILVTDAQGERIEMECGIVRELANETEAKMG